jgi:hypothetical protein
MVRVRFAPVSGLAALWSQYWDFVLGIIIGGLLGFLANWFFYRKSKKSKRLSWEGLTGNRIIQANASARKNFAVSYEGSEVKDPNILVIRIGNTGDEVVRSEDFAPDDSIVVDFKPAKLLLLDVVHRSDPNIGNYRLVQNDHDMAYVPAYLNAGEWLDFQFITDGPLNRPKMKCRFAGQTHPFKSVRDSYNLNRKMALNMAVVAFFIALSGASLASTIEPGTQGWPLAISLLSTSVAVIWTFFNFRSVRRGPFPWKVTKSAAKRAIDEEENLSSEEEETPITSGKF